MEFHRIREALQDILQMEECKKGLQTIKYENDDEKVVVVILTEIVGEHLIYEPKDIPYHSWHQIGMMILSRQKKEIRH